MKIALVGPAHPYKGGGARHTTELAHRLAAQGHDVIIESWRAQYPGRLYPGQQTVDVPEGEPYPRTRRRLAWYRPDGWRAEGRRLRPADLVLYDGDCFEHAAHVTYTILEGKIVFDRAEYLAMPFARRALPLVTGAGGDWGGWTLPNIAGQHAPSTQAAAAQQGGNRGVELWTIDPQGKIAKRYKDVDPKENSKQVLADLAALKKTAG